MTRPILSILIPFHASAASDRRAMLTELLTTIPDRKDIEIVVVDDHSTLVFDRAAAKRETLKMYPLPDGLRFAGAARNHAMKLSSADFCLFADSDDLFDKDRLNLLCDKLKHANPQDRVVYLLQSHEFVGAADAAKPALYSQALLATSKSDTAQLLLGWHAPWGKVFPRDEALRAGLKFDEDQRVANDSMFSARLAFFATSTFVVPGPTYFVRRQHNAGALTSLRDTQSVRVRIETFRKVNTYVRTMGRADLVIPMHHAFRSFFKVAPRVVISEIVKSITSGEQILPRRLHAK